jgi:hypothetical protein
MYQLFSFQGTPKIYPSLEFWFDNIPSGNPGGSLCRADCHQEHLYAKVTKNSLERATKKLSKVMP